MRGWSSSSSPIHSLSHSHASQAFTSVFCSACCALSDQQADKKRHFIYIYLSSANLFSSAECKQCISLSPGVLPCTFNQVNFLSEAFPHGMNNSTDMHSIPFHSVCAIHIRISFNRGWGGGSQEDERRQEDPKEGRFKAKSASKRQTNVIKTFLLFQHEVILTSAHRRASQRTNQMNSREMGLWLCRWGCGGEGNCRPQISLIQFDCLALPSAWGQHRNELARMTNTMWVYL